MSLIRMLLARFARSQAGTATIEFVIVLPFVLAMLFTSIDFGAVMLRQVFLDRATDLAVREVMLGNIPSNGHATLRQLICDGTILIPNCTASLTLELRPIDTNTWAGLNAPAQCVNRAANISPTLTFDPSTGNQDLMLVRVCAAADPFITWTGFVMGLNQNAGGDYLLVSLGAFTNEPT